MSEERGGWLNILDIDCATPWTRLDPTMKAGIGRQNVFLMPEGIATLRDRMPTLAQVVWEDAVAPGTGVATTRLAISPRRLTVTTDKGADALATMRHVALLPIPPEHIRSLS